jgi:uncharacterized protein YxeA
VKTTMLILAMVFTAGIAVSHAQTKKDEHTMKGYLIDKMCGSTMAKKSPEQAMVSAAKHTKACATEEDCAASGYGLMMDGKWTAFDDSGNKKAADYLAKTKRKDHLYVAVTGTPAAEKIMVTLIKDAKEKKQ